MKLYALDLSATVARGAAPDELPRAAPLPLERGVVDSCYTLELPCELLTIERGTVTMKITHDQLASAHRRSVTIEWERDDPNAPAAKFGWSNPKPGVITRVRLAFTWKPSEGGWTCDSVRQSGHVRLKSGQLSSVVSSVDGFHRPMWLLDLIHDHRPTTSVTVAER
jgi:hypothetical protein